MKREPMQQAAGFGTSWRYVLCLLVPIFFLGLPAVIAAAETVDVRLSEYAIEMPGTLPAGPTTFLVHNEGGKNHSFKVVGPGVDELLALPLKPQESGKLEVTLQPGEYKIYCPIGSHEVKGMTRKLVVK